MTASLAQIIAEIDADERRIRVQMEGDATVWMTLDEFIKQHGKLAHGWIALHNYTGSRSLPSPSPTAKQLPSLAVENIRSYSEEGQFQHAIALLYELVDASHMPPQNLVRRLVNDILSARSVLVSDTMRCLEKIGMYHGILGCSGMWLGNVHDHTDGGIKRSDAKLPHGLLPFLLHLLGNDADAASTALLKFILTLLSKDTIRAMSTDISTATLANEDVLGTWRESLKAMLQGSPDAETDVRILAPFAWMSLSQHIRVDDLVTLIVCAKSDPEILRLSFPPELNWFRVLVLDRILSEYAKNLDLSDVDRPEKYFHSYFTLEKLTGLFLRVYPKSIVSENTSNVDPTENDVVVESKPKNRLPTNAALYPSFLLMLIQCWLAQESVFRTYAETNSIGTEIQRMCAQWEDRLDTYAISKDLDSCRRRVRLMMLTPLVV